MRALADIIRTEIKDPRMDPLTSVMSVEVAPDLKTCKVEVSVLGDEAHKEDTLKALRSASGYIRTLLARRVDLRNTPELTFHLDNSTEYGIEMCVKTAFPPEMKYVKNIAVADAKHDEVVEQIEESSYYDEKIETEKQEQLTMQAEYSDE